MADQNEQENQEAQRRAADAAVELERSLRAASAELLAMGRVTEKTSAEVGKSQAAYARSGGDSVKILKSAFDKAREAGLNLEDALKQAATAARGWGRMVGDALDTLAQAAIGTAVTLQRGNKGLTAYDQQIQQMSGAVKGAAGALQALGPIGAGFGKALGIAGDATTQLALAATNMGDTLYTSFGALNRAGGAAADGMTGLLGDAKNLGLGMNELSALTDAVAGRAQDFALFGGSVADARKRLGQMGDQLRDNRESFLSLGMTMPEVTEGLANYVALQSRLGRGQSQTTAQMAESARKYLMEQDALTKLLGINRQEQEAAQQRALLNEQFGAKIRQLQLDGQHDVVAELLKAAKMYAAFGPQSEAAFHGAVTENLAATETVKGMQSSFGELGRTTSAMLNKQMKATEAVQTTGQAMGKYGDTVGIVTGQMLTNNESAIAFHETQRARIISDKNLTEEEKKIHLEQMRMGAEGAKAQDPVLAAQAKLMNTQIMANESLDHLVFKVLPFVQFGMQHLTDGALAAARALNKLSDEDPKSVADQKVIEENTRALESMQGKLGEAEAAYEKTMQGATTLQKMGIGRTDEQQAAFDRQKELRARESALKRGITTAESGARGMETAGGMGMPGEAPVPEAAPKGAPKSAAGAPQASGPQRFSEEDLVRRGLRIKPGATQQRGSVIQPNAVDLAEQVQKQIAGFSRITGFDDGHMRSATSKHQQGRAFDFTVVPNPSREEGERIVGQLKGMGASYAQDEYHNRSDNATGPHFHVEVPAMAKGGITSGVSIAGEAGPEAVVPLPNGKSIPVDMSGLGPISVDMSGLGPISVDMSGQGMDKMHSSSAMLQQAADSLNALGVGSGRDLDQSLKDAMAHLREILLEAPQTADITKSLADLDSSMTEWNRVSAVTGGNFAFAQEKLLPDMLASAQGSAVDTDFYKNIEAQIKTPSGTQLGTIDDLRQMLSEQSTNNVDSLRETQSEFRSALGQIVQEIRQNQQSNLQQEILQTLQSINRSQGRTADASQRMADVAMN